MSINLSQIRQRFSKIGWVLLTDTLDADMQRWAYGIRKGSSKVCFSSMQALMAALRGHEHTYQERAKTNG